MRFEAVHARSFGPFKDRSLVLAPGLTLIHGPNESGKSSWHAALFGGLCGMRRAKGSPRSEERDFAERHRPWNAETWEVGALIALDDGRRIELRHDLDGRVDCRAVDATLGRDVSAEIMYEGAPDGARFVGLDRRAFIATACIRQADLLGICDHSELLQEHLQRAAASARGDSTAAAAIARLDEYQREQIGVNRANATKPLRRALDRVESATAAVRAATDQHRDYCRLIARADELRVEATRTRDRVRALQAVHAMREATSWAARLARARELASRLGEGPPASLAADDELAAAVEATLRGWDDRPSVETLPGISAVEIRWRIAELPIVPEGDQEPDPVILAARKAHEESHHALRLHEADRPPPPKQPDTGGATEDMLRDLARDLELEPPAIEDALRQRVENAEQYIRELVDTPRRRGVLVLSVAAALFGASAITLDAPIAGLAMIAVAGVAMIAWMLLRTGPQVRVNALADLRSAEEALAERKHAAADAERRRAAAETAVAASGLPATPAALRGLARDLAEASQCERAQERWTIRQHHLTSAVGAAQTHLTSELARRGAAGKENVVEAFSSYLASCTERTRLAAEAARRPDLERELTAREAAEQAVARAEQRCARAEDDLRRVAERCGVPIRPDTAATEALTEALRTWQSARTAGIAESEQRRREWTELETLLGGEPLEALATKVAALDLEAARLRAAVDPRLIADAELGPQDRPITALQRDAEEAAREAALAEGTLAGRDVASVAEAEEELALAKADLDRLHRLERTLALTRRFLARAQERVHRDIAPLLAETVRHSLAAVTADRYIDILVDPESLQVRVRSAGGEWREANALSHGTTEQIYLLLRMALAKHLAKPGESCPLILDDVTVQSDRTRTLAILAVLRAISRERQVVVFSQEDEVLAWANETLTEPTDRIERLDPLPVAG